MPCGLRWPPWMPLPEASLGWPEPACKRGTAALRRRPSCLAVRTAQLMSTYGGLWSWRIPRQSTWSLSNQWWGQRTWHRLSQLWKRAMASLASPWRQRLSSARVTQRRSRWLSMDRPRQDRQQLLLLWTPQRSRALHPRRAQTTPLPATDRPTELVTVTPRRQRAGQRMTWTRQRCRPRCQLGPRSTRSTMTPTRRAAAHAARLPPLPSPWTMARAQPAVTRPTIRLVRPPRQPRGSGGTAPIPLASRPRTGLPQRPRPPAMATPT